MTVLLFTEFNTMGYLDYGIVIGMGSGKEHYQDAVPQDPVIMGVDVTLVS